VTTLLPGFIDTPLARGTQENLDQQPFVLSPNEAATLCKKAIAKKTTRYIFPFQMRIIATLFSFIPKTIYVRLYQHFMKDTGTEQND
jgi:short-subunit dehydrogenase